MMNQAIPLEVPQLQSAQRIIVQLTTIDGMEEVIQATGPITLQPGILMIPTREGHIGYPLERLKRWEAVASPISLGMGR